MDIPNAFGIEVEKWKRSRMNEEKYFCEMHCIDT